MNFKRFFAIPWIPITLVLVFAVLLRIPQLSGSFWLDEAAQALESTRPFSQQLNIRDDFQPPLLHLLLHAAQYISIQEWWLRFIGALIPGIISIYFTYKIGQEFKSKITGLIAASLLTTSSFHIFYSQELRQYSLPAMFALISWYCLYKITKADKFSWPLGIIFSLISACGMYSSYLYPFILITQALWLFFHNKKYFIQWIKVLGLTALLFLPWMPFFLGQLEAGTELQSSLPGWGRVVSPTQLKALPLIVIKFIYGVLNVEVTPFYVLSAVLIFTLLLLCLVKRKYLVQTFQQNKLFLWWLILPIFGAWLVSFWIPVLQPKRVLYCLPALYLLISSLAERELVSASSKNFLRSALKYPATLLAILLFFINIFSTVSYWRDPHLQRENWRGLVNTIEQRYPMGAIAIFSFPEPFAPWRWYADADYPALASKELLLSKERTRVLLEAASDYNFVITFDYLADLTDPGRMLNQQLIAYGYKEIEVIDYPVIGFVRIYSKPEAVISYR